MASDKNAASPFSIQREQLLGAFIHAGLLRTPAIIRAMREVARENFLPPSMRPHAWEDNALPVGHGATLSAPHMYAMMLEAAELKEGQRCLEIGTGSGYGAALMAKLVDKKGSVYSVELVEELADFAKRNLAENGFGNVRVICVDGKAGYPPFSPYARILITAECAAAVPAALFEQLAEGGFLLAPVREHAGGVAILKLYQKSAGRISLLSDLGPVLFVPLR